MNKRSTKWYRKNEAEVMHRLGLKPTKNSGAGWIEKCDGESRHFICELKSTDHESFSIKQSVLHVLEHHALEAHKIPLFAFQFINRNEVWVAIKEGDIQAYRELIERDVLNKLEEEDSELLKKYKICKKGIDNQNKKEYYKGEKERGGFEAVSFMPNTNANTNDNSNSNSNNNSNSNKNSNSNRNSNIKQDIDVIQDVDIINDVNIKQDINVIDDINVIQSIDVNKVKHNINARNNYFKQKEQERRKQEQKFRTERRKTK